MQWRNNENMIQTMVTKSNPNMCQYPRHRPPPPRAQPLTTCSQITSKLQSHYRTYRILNIDASVELANQHASYVDMTIRASPHKRRRSILPTNNINTSDHHTHTIHCHALYQHRTTTTSTIANISDPNTHIHTTNRITRKLTTRYWKMKIYSK